MKKSINVITLGCAKNVVDSEVLIKQLVQAGFEVFFDSNTPSNIIIINTCGFIHDAKVESIETIMQAVALKIDKQVEAVFVMGCLSQRYRDDLAQEIPEVDGWFGVLELQEILTAITPDYIASDLTERTITTPSHYAYLKIAEGCDRSCSFCIIPSIRGPHISKPIETILEEAKILVKNGVKEILLVAQDLTWYGVDIYKKQALGELVTLLAEESGASWIRLHYTYPSSFPKDTLEAIARYDTICNYMDIPLQHINDRILTSMKRGLGKQGTYDLIASFRAMVPDIAIRTAFIVGYPGETIEEFEELKQFVAEMKFDRVGVFTYSHEEDTAAAELDDSISQEEKERRAEEIMTIQEGISLERNQALIGKTVQVLLDREEDEYFVGRTQYDSPEVDNEVLVRKQPSLRCGEFYRVKITAADAFEIEGEVI